MREGAGALNPTTSEYNPNDKKGSPRHLSHEKDDWMTPADVVERVRIALGGTIGLDPASNSHDRPNIPAERHYTTVDDGLAQDWNAATGFLNPPYSAATRWVKKGVSEVAAGHLGALVILQSARPDGQRFHICKPYPVAFTAGRIGFIDPATGKPATRNTGGSMFHLVKQSIAADDFARFYEAFSPFCSVYRGGER